MLAIVCAAATFLQGQSRPSDDIEALINRLKRTQEKGEFETTQQYKARLNGIVDPNKQLIFPVIDSHGIDHFGVRFEYDADAGMMMMNMESTIDWILDPEEQTLILGVKHSERSTGKHIGMTTMGVRMPYESSTENWYGVIIRQPFPDWLEANSQPIGDAGDRRYQFSIPMSASAAKATKPFLRARIVGTVSSRKIYHDHMTLTPKLDAPWEQSISQDYAEFNLQEIQIVDLQNGRTLKSYKKGGPADASRPAVTEEVPSQKM